MLGTDLLFYEIGTRFLLCFGRSLAVTLTLLVTMGSAWLRRTERASTYEVVLGHNNLSRLLTGRLSEEQCRFR